MKLQDRRAVAEPDRAEDGTLLPGSGSLNPGGQPKWVKAFRDAMRDRCAPLAEKHLFRVLGGVEPGQAVDDPVYSGLTADDRTKAAKVVLELVLPKPKQSVKVSGDRKNPLGPLVGWTPEQLLALAKDAPKGEP
jgi:hypothetical protein